MWGALGALAVAVLVTGALWNRTPENAARTAIASSGAGAVSTETATADAASKPQDFPRLPPAERINAETKLRMEQNAAWREKLRSGDYTALPPEAYPPGSQPSP